MSLPIPVPGLVIRFQFLWRQDYLNGRETGEKARPCVVVVAVKRNDSGHIEVIVAPITHTPPTDPSQSIELSATTCGEAGLDFQRQWVRTDELNQFTWPGFDLETIPGRGREIAYAMIPLARFEVIKKSILAKARAGAVKPVSRDQV